MKNLNIGITISVYDNQNIWNNGITQNIINLALILKNSKNNYTVDILNTGDNNILEYDIDGISVYPIKDKLKDLDILFILGSQIDDVDYDYLKKKGSKIIYYPCGTNYVLDMESILFNSIPERTKLYKHIPDEIWLIPQNSNINKYYFDTLYRKKVKEVPFIWSSTFIDYAIKEYNIDCYYNPSTEPKRISCFEPNLNVVKFAMYNILIAERVYRERPELIKHFYVTNAMKIKTNPLFVNLMNQLDIIKDGIATFEGRYSMPYFLDTYTDVVISHQWENPLNYAYLDALYLNYPIVHNAHLIKNVGYYYDGFDIKKGKEKLLFALTEHDKNMEEYNEKSKKELKKYLPTNPKLIDIYDNMIDELFKK